MCCGKTESIKSS